MSTVPSRLHRGFFRVMLSSTLIAASALAVLNGCSSRRPVRAITPSIGVRQTGIASWYGHPYHGRATASGETYDMESNTAAHRRYTFGTWLRVDNLDNGKQTEVRINDRGPFVRGRVIDLSRASAREIEMLGPGTAKVKLTVIGVPAPTSASRAVAAATPPSQTPHAAPATLPAHWGVQVASFRNPSLANALAERLRHEGRHSRTYESGVWTRVVVLGRDVSQDGARQLREELLADFPGATLFSTGFPEI
jgi:rare lipoprotein A